MNTSNKYSLCLVFLNLLLLVSSAAWAQQPLQIGPRQPELEALVRMVGIWETTAKCRFSPEATIFEGKSIENVYWSKSGLFLISDQCGLTPAGWVNALEVTAWDPIKKQFQIIDLTPGASSDEKVMTIEGNIGKATGTRTSAGHTTRTWITFEYVSSTECRFRSECSIDGGPKWLFSEGASKKVKSNIN